MPLRVSLVNLQKFTFQPWLDTPSMKMLAPEQNTRSRTLVTTTRAHFGVLEADALQCVVQLDVHAEVIRVELELVSGADACVFVNGQRQRGHCAIEGQFHVLVLGRFGPVINDWVRRHVGLLAVRGG